MLPKHTLDPAPLTLQDPPSLWQLHPAWAAFLWGCAGLSALALRLCCGKLARPHSSAVTSALTRPSQRCQTQLQDLGPAH
jgi:hypothetical protein